MKADWIELELNSKFTLQGFFFSSREKKKFPFSFLEEYSVYKVINKEDDLLYLIRNGLDIKNSRLNGYFYIYKDDDILDDDIFFITGIEEIKNA